MKKPSDFTIYPWDSAAGKCEAETVARNIMVILSRTGDHWRWLDWDEYKAERLKDGDFTEGEYNYFNQVSKFCSAEYRAREFSREWEKV